MQCPCRAVFELNDIIKLCQRARSRHFAENKTNGKSAWTWWVHCIANSISVSILDDIDPIDSYVRCFVSTAAEVKQSVLCCFAVCTHVRIGLIAFYAGNKGNGYVALHVCLPECNYVLIYCLICLLSSITRELVVRVICSDRRDLVFCSCCVLSHDMVAFQFSFNPYVSTHKLRISIFCPPGNCVMSHTWNITPLLFCSW